MDKVALLSTKDRATLFGESGAARGVANTIIEKDFWVCWTLKRLFALQGEKFATLVFKGGTSLSKAYGAIRRFSEDIDLSFDRADLGYTGDRDPEKEGLSKKKASQLIEDLVADVERHIAEKLLPALRRALLDQLGEPKDGEWSLEIDPHDAQTVNFQYPAALEATHYEGMAYITPRVKLELGARGDPWPTEEKTIRPYAAEDFPAFFEDPGTSVIVLSARRTFWEKATALHAEAHRPIKSPTPQYFSRHYYDLAMLLDTDEGKAAAADSDLLATGRQTQGDVFPFRMGKLRVRQAGQPSPDAARSPHQGFRSDYREMAPMMFDDRPLSFDDILARIEKLQEAINN